MSDIRLTGWNLAYKAAFYDINIAWLEEHFTVEPKHRAVLSNPEDEILAGGGEVFFALKDGVAVGTVAVRADGGGVYELTKLGVTPAARGLGLGRLLCEAVIDWFSAQGGTRLYLETHTKLTAAMRLYEALGFVTGTNPSGDAYAGTDCYMEWRGSPASSDGKAA
ncbi:GNAT family N-acetyltransferase [Pseudokordiimonas caeni]|uniref:GNAT family N-acetyltransferase n=1 Tax=Pseudokordiimonas caeni TaxID=2997908 RepID=UPI002810EE2B|nr:GNAT family N-acetyltransferase [Pseudokordiimonas caeni]